MKAFHTRKRSVFFPSLQKKTARELGIMWILTKIKLNCLNTAQMADTFSLSDITFGFNNIRRTEVEAQFVNCIKIKLS